MIFLSNCIIIFMFMLPFGTDPKCIFNVDVHKFFLCVRLRARISSRIQNLFFFFDVNYDNFNKKKKTVHQKSLNAPQKKDKILTKRQTQIKTLHAGLTHALLYYHTLAQQKMNILLTE